MSSAHILICLTLTFCVWTALFLKLIRARLTRTSLFLTIYCYWCQTLEQNQAYTDQEMREFEEHLAREENDLNQKTVDLQKQRQELERQQETLNAQKVELQQVTTHTHTHTHTHKHTHTDT